MRLWPEKHDNHRSSNEGNNCEIVAKIEAIASPWRVVLDLDSTEIPVYGEQEQSAYNGYFESTCYHPLLLFNRRLFVGMLGKIAALPLPAG